MAGSPGSGPLSPFAGSRGTSVPGTDETYSVDTVQKAIAFDRQLAEVVVAGASPTLAVIGAGFTEIELALDLRDRVAHHGTRMQADDARVLLMAAAAFAGNVPGEHDALGRVVVDRSLRAPAAPEVFVAGAAAAADGGGGRVALQSCQHALQLGRFAGEDAARDLIGLPTITYVQPLYITCLTCGRTEWSRLVLI